MSKMQTENVILFSTKIKYEQTNKNLKSIDRRNVNE